MKQAYTIIKKKHENQKKKEHPKIKINTIIVYKEY